MFNGLFERGSAYTLLLELSFEGKNHKAVLQILKNNYEGKDQVIQNLLYKIVDLPYPQHDHKALNHFRVTTGIVKSCLRKTLHQTRLTLEENQTRLALEELRTIVIMIENKV